MTPPKGTHRLRQDRNSTYYSALASGTARASTEESGSDIAVAVTGPATTASSAASRGRPLLRPELRARRASPGRPAKAADKGRASRAVGAGPAAADGHGEGLGDGVAAPPSPGAAIAGVQDGTATVADSATTRNGLLDDAATYPTFSSHHREMRPGVWAGGAALAAPSDAAHVPAGTPEASGRDRAAPWPLAGAGSEHVLVGPARPGRSVGLSTGGPPMPLAVDERFAPAAAGSQPASEAHARVPSVRDAGTACPDATAAAAAAAATPRPSRTTVATPAGALTARPASQRHMRCMLAALELAEQAATKDTPRPHVARAGGAKRAKSRARTK